MTVFEKYLTECKKYSTLIKIYINQGCYPKDKITHIEEVLKKRYLFFKRSDRNEKDYVRGAAPRLEQLKRLYNYAHKPQIAQITKTIRGKKVIYIGDYEYDFEDEYAPTPSGKYIEIDVYEQVVSEDKPFQIFHECNGDIKVSARACAPSKYVNRAAPQSYDKKLPNSISRAYSKVCELYVSNQWDYHVTLTINPNLHDCEDIDEFMKKLCKWFNNYTKKTSGQKLDYVLIPELRYGAYHIHGVIRGIPPEHLSPFKRGKHPNYLVDKGYLNWTSYSEKFGFCSLRKIPSKKAGLPLYAAKDIKMTSKFKRRKKGCRLYYRSQGLKCFKEVFRGENLIANIAFEFENEWVKTTHLSI